jgi:ribosomal-protein-alanine N-acetyltransferase
MKLPVTIRVFAPCDPDALLDIEYTAWEEPKPVSDLKKTMAKVTTVTLVAVHGKTVVGFAVVSVSDSRIHVLDLAVHEEHRLCGVGTELVGYLKSQLVPGGTLKKIVLEVTESNVAAQLFLRSTGLRCEKILRGHFSDGEDCYVFAAYRHGNAAEQKSLFGVDECVGK